MSNFILEEDNGKQEEIRSRFMNINTKKYLLAGVDQSVEQLNKEQTDNLTKLLISLKSEYDTLTREVTKKKKETEQLSKQIVILEKMDNKFKDKVAELEDQSLNFNFNKELQKKRLDEENYARQSYIHLINRIKDDLNVIKKDINDREMYSQKLDKQFEKEKLIESAIKEKLNQIHSHKLSSEQKNKIDQSESELILKYYNTIIHQKWSFIQSADERKLKQQKISLQAKNDTLDKQEVEKRKALHLLKFYNKFLRKKIDNLVNDNKELETTFNKIKNITGTSNLKIIVDKILNKDKDYNQCVTTVTEKEALINKLKREIKLLEEEYKKFKSNYNNDNSSTSPSENDKSTTTKDSSTLDIKIYDEEEEKLVNEEKELMNEMNEIGSKYRNVDIVYDRVIFNLKKILTKYQSSISAKDKIKEDKEAKSFEEGTSDNEDKEKEKEKEKEKDKNKSEVIMKYEKILEVNSERISKFLQGNSKETFENIVRDKFKIVEPKSKTEHKQSVKLEGALTKQTNVPGKLVEYDYEDRDVKDEDRQINEHVQVLNRIYWNEVSIKIYL